MIIHSFIAGLTELCDYAKVLFFFNFSIQNINIIGEFKRQFVGRALLKTLLKYQ